MKPISANDILCFKCAKSDKFTADGYGSAIVWCGPNSKRLSPRAPRVQCDNFTPRFECEKCSPVNIGWCTGNCKKCTLTTEWQEWA